MNAMMVHRRESHQNAEVAPFKTATSLFAQKKTEKKSKRSSFFLNPNSNSVPSLFGSTQQTQEANTFVKPTEINSQWGAPRTTQWGAPRTTQWGALPTSVFGAPPTSWGANQPSLPIAIPAMSFAATQPTGDTLEKMAALSDKLSKVLFLIAVCFREQRITAHHKGVLKGKVKYTQHLTVSKTCYFLIEPKACTPLWKW